MRQVIPAVLLIIVLYLLAYGVVRVTHTHYWFDKTTEERTNYTLFDTYSDTDMVLFRVFYPMLVLDSKVSRRHFVKDKW